MRTLNVLNKLFTTAIVFTMINLNIAINIEQARFNINSAQAYAQEESSSTAGSNDTPEVRSADGTVVLENTQDSDTDSMREKRQKMSGTYNKKEGSSIFGGGLIPVLALFVVAYITMRIWLFTKGLYGDVTKPYDVYAAAAGAGILVVSELMAAFKQTESLKDRKKKIEYEGLSEDGSVDISQKQILEEEKAALEELKSTAESKASYQKAGAAAFSVAAGISAWNGMMRNKARLACEGLLKNVKISMSNFSTESANCADPSNSSFAAGGVTTVGKMVTEIEAAETISISPGQSEEEGPIIETLVADIIQSQVAITGMAENLITSAPKVCAANIKAAEAGTAASFGGAGVELAVLEKAGAMLAGHVSYLTPIITQMNTACTNYTKLVQGETIIIFSKAVGASVAENSKPKNIYVRLFDIITKKIAPNAYAGALDKFGGTLGILIGATAAYFFPAGQFMSSLMISNYKRAGLWLGLSGMALTASMATENEAKAIDSNIKKIDAILKKFRSAESVTSVESKTMQKKASALTRYQAQQLGTEVECVGGLPKIATNNGSKACPSAERYITNATSGLNSAGFSIPDSLTGSLVNATNGIQDTSSISGSTQSDFDSLGNAANALNKKAASAVKKMLSLSDQSKDKKKKKVSDPLAAFKNGFNKFNKKTGSSGGLMSALPYLSNPANKNSSDEGSDEVAGQQDGLAAKTDGGAGIGAIKTPKSSGFKFKFGQDDADSYAAQKHAEFDATADAVADMEDSGEGEIIEDKNVDIWKVISVRYKKTAYDRLLKRIE